MECFLPLYRGGIPAATGTAQSLLPEPNSSTYLRGHKMKFGRIGGLLGPRRSKMLTRKLATQLSIYYGVQIRGTKQLLLFKKDDYPGGPTLITNLP